MSIPLDTFTTSRLRGERLTPEHRAEIARMHEDPAVMAHLGGVRGDAQTDAYLVRNLAHWAQYGHGLWIVRDGRDGRIAGRAVLRHLEIEGVDEVEIGYAFYAEWWGQGLATEVAQACVEMGFHRIDRSSVVGVTQPKNQGSQRVLEKVGLVREREFLHDGTPHLLFRARR